MKTFKQCAAQGDLLIVKADKIPDGWIEEESKKDYIVAHSETGHHHTVSANAAILFKNPENPMVMFLKLTQDNADFIHHRSFDTHETLRAEGGAGSIYEIRRQREYTPEGWRRVED